MDITEIIERLKNIAEHAIHTVGEEPFVMSLDDGIAVHEAIELLEKTETNRPEIPDSSDAISRQDAIEAINLWLYCDKDERMPADVIKALPSVQTEIIHCKDCLYKKICSWKSQGATFCKRSAVSEREVMQNDNWKPFT